MRPFCNVDLLVKVVNPLTPERTLKELSEAHRRCEDVNQMTEGYAKALQDTRASLANGKCFLEMTALVVRFIRNTSIPIYSCSYPFSLSFGRSATSCKYKQGVSKHQNGRKYDLSDLE